MIALCTNKEIIEMDMKNLLLNRNAAAHIDDECEMDILALTSQTQGFDHRFSSFLLISYFV